MPADLKLVKGAPREAEAASLDISVSTDLRTLALEEHGRAKVGELFERARTLLATLAEEGEQPGSDSGLHEELLAFQDAAQEILDVAEALEEEETEFLSDDLLEEVVAAYEASLLVTAKEPDSLLSLSNIAYFEFTLVELLEEGEGRQEPAPANED